MSTKHRQWAGALAQNCGIKTMLQETAPTPQPVAHVNGEASKRRWRRMPSDRRDAIRADYLAGKTFDEIRRDRDVSNGSISHATSDLPRRPMSPKKTPPDARPVRMDGESTQKFAGRVMAWKLRTDPAFREACGRAKGDGRRRAVHKRKMAELEAERMALAEERAKLQTPPPVEIPPPPPPPEPTAAREPPLGWGEKPEPPPRVGFLRSIGMMLGLVR